MAGRSGQLEVGGRRLELSNLDKVLYPGGSFRKADVVDYYVNVSEWLLPHLEDRPVTLKRYPDGVTGEHFYEKDAPSFTPPWVRTVPVARRSGGAPIRYVVIDDLATLVWLANLANLEIHPFLHRASTAGPTSMVFDLDPGEGADVLTCARVAVLLREILEHLGLASLAKVTGSKGIQVHVPLRGEATYPVTASMAKAIAQLLEEKHPELIVSEMPLSVRAGKVFIDWSQNSDYKTTVAVYSLRANAAVPYVSMPVEWDELVSATKAQKKARLAFTPGAALRRLREVGDLFGPVLSLEQAIPEEFVRTVAARRRPPKAEPGSLAEYRSRRNFSVTPEPSATRRRASRQGSRRRFVVQKHAASHLHYDFRLEMHGVLKSWAVPKGPSPTKDEARLARATEDHPLDYLEFEGIIPKHQYGGGTVMVWDIGTWELIEGNYYKGFLRFHLEGRKLTGEWILRSDGEGGTWRLVRSGPSVAPAIAGEADRSATTGRTMNEIAEAADAVWESNRAGSTAPVRASARARSRKAVSPKAPTAPRRR